MNISALENIIKQDDFISLLNKTNGVSLENIVDQEENNLLHLATRHNALMIATFLLSSYPHLAQQQNKDGQSPLHLFCLSNPQTPTLGQTLIPYSNLSQVDHAGYTVFSLAQECAPDFVVSLFSENISMKVTV